MTLLDRYAARRTWDEQEQMVLDQVQKVADEVIAPAAAGYDASGEYPEASMDAINAMGLNAIFVPEAYGGAPMSYRLYLECVSIISEACASTGIIYATNFHGMKPLIDFGSEEQKERLLPAIAEGGMGSLAITEPSAGSDATGMKTKFTPDGDDILVDGEKIFISNGDVADRILLFGKWSEIDDA
ncbi:MAG: acyl-CoA dehydrogenase family protein, partial [Pseudomonadota bacterium]